MLETRHLKFSSSVIRIHYNPYTISLEGLLTMAYLQWAALLSKVLRFLNHAVVRCVGGCFDIGIEPKRRFQDSQTRLRNKPVKLSSHQLQGIVRRIAEAD